MDTLRFVATALGLFIVVFFGIRELTAAHQLKPDARMPTFQRADVNDPRHKMETTSFASDNDTVRDALRQAVLVSANTLSQQPCDPAIRARYVEAATNYARAWLSIAPCVGTRTCGSSDGRRLEHAQKAFGSPLDRRVREAMMTAHEAGVFASSDFPKDAVIMVGEMASDPVINPRATIFNEVRKKFRGAPPCHATSLQ